MARTFSSPLGGDPHAALAEAPRRAAAQGLTFHGDERSGRITGLMLFATYAVGDESVTVTVHQKPRFHSWEQVEETLRELLGA